MIATKARTELHVAHIIHVMIMMGVFMEHIFRSRRIPQKSKTSNQHWAKTGRSSLGAQVSYILYIIEFTNNFLFRIIVPDVQKVVQKFKVVLAMFR